MPRIYHTGDIHFANHESETAWSEQTALCDALVERAAVARPDLIALGGDLDDAVRVKLSPRLRSAVRRLVSGFAAVAPVIVTRGNHDLWDDLLHLRDIEGVRFCQEAEAYTQDTADGPLHILALPYPGHGWSVVDLRNVAPGHRQGAQEDGLRQIIADWRAGLRPDDTSIVVYHGAVAGAVVNVFQHVKSSEPALAFEDFGCDMGAYCGAPYPQRFGDPAQHGRGPLLWTIPRGRSALLAAHIHTPQQWHATTGHGITAERLEMDAHYRKRLTYDVEWSPENEALQWSDGTPWEGLPASGFAALTTASGYIKGAHVRVKVAFPSYARASVDSLGIEAAFAEAGAATVKILPDVTQRASATQIAEFAQSRRLSHYERVRLVLDATGEEISDERDAWLRDACLEIDQMEAVA